MDCERFKSITKLRGWFFTRCRAVTPLANFHAAINRNQASIGVEAEGEKEANQEERQKFLERSHINFYYSLESHSRQETVLPGNLQYSVVFQSNTLRIQVNRLFLGGITGYLW